MSAPIAARSWSLRVQLLVGLAVILFAVCLSLGTLAVWAVGRSQAETQFANMQRLSWAVAAVVAGVVGGEHEDTDVKLTQLISRLGSDPWQAVTVVDRAGTVLATAGTPAEATDARDPTHTTVFARSLSTGSLQSEVVADGTLVEIAVPIRVNSQIRGAVQLRFPVRGQPGVFVPSFWFLLGLGSLALMAFVAVVVTRYVARPIEGMQRAATKVAAGDLAVALSEEGPAELASLARSFNQMTGALRAHLQQLAEKQEQLARSAKLASLGRLAAGVAHEVGNPLQAIIGFVDVLRSGQIEAAEAADLLARIEQESVRIHGIIRELLDYSRPDGGEIKAVPLARVVDQAWRLVSAQQRAKGVSLTVNAVAELPAVSANEQRLVQVVLNLLLNAIDAIAGEGDIEVRANVADRDRVQLHVTNSGSPIAEDERSRIFEPFHTTKEPGAGTGLGLPVSRALVESYGGTLELSDDALTCFVLTLPSY